MEVKLLRLDINEAIAETNELERVNAFWVIARHFDDCYLAFKVTYCDEKISKIISEECPITRCENGFFVQDPYGNQDVFTRDEISLFVDLWEKAQEIKPNVVVWDNTEK